MLIVIQTLDLNVAIVLRDNLETESNHLVFHPVRYVFPALVMTNEEGVLARRQVIIAFMIEVYDLLAAIRTMDGQIVVNTAVMNIHRRDLFSV